MFSNLGIQLLSKFEVNEKFARFPSFQFWVLGKIKNSEISEICNFRLNHMVYLLVFVSVYYFGVFKSWVTTSVKIRRKRKWVFYPDYRAKSKTWKPQEYILFLLKPCYVMLYFLYFDLVRNSSIHEKYSLIKAKLQLQTNNPNIYIKKNKNHLKFLLLQLQNLCLIIMNK